LRSKWYRLYEMSGGGTLSEAEDADAHRGTSLGGG
jgi:hypothetical protein